MYSEIRGENLVVTMPPGLAPLFRVLCAGDRESASGPSRHMAWRFRRAVAGAEGCAVTERPATAAWRPREELFQSVRAVRRRRGSTEPEETQHRQNHDYDAENVEWIHKFPPLAFEGNLQVAVIVPS